MALNLDVVLREVSLPCLDLVISRKYFLNITHISMDIWFEEVTLQLICTSNAFEITFFIWIINRWASEELELQFLKPGFNYRWCMCFMLIYSTDSFRIYLSIRKSHYLG